MSIKRLRELECVPGWRYCRVDRNSKAPKYANWQKIHYELKDIPDDSNIGLLLGPSSGGIVAIDFDGPFAWDFWDKNIPYDLANLNTVTWSSGREARCQMGFTVPEEMWEHLKTVKIPHTNTSIKEGLEFRWANTQSVLPPSIHPDTKKPYEWLSPPSKNIQELPIEILEWWYNRTASKEAEVYSGPVYKPSSDVEKRVIIDCLLGMTFSYDEWIKVGWGMRAGGFDLASFIYATKENNYAEAKSVWNGFKEGGCNLGTVKNIIGKKALAAQKETALALLAREMREKYNLTGETK